MDSFICQVHGLFAHPVWDNPAAAAAIIGPVIAAIIAFGLPSFYLYRQHKKKIKASVVLIREYVIGYIYMDQETWLEFHTNLHESKERIARGDPYGEVDKNYTPLTIVHSKEDELSFEQIRESFPYFNKDEQKALLKFLRAQAWRSAIIQAMDTDFFRTFPQKRKQVLWEVYDKSCRNLQQESIALNHCLEKTKTRWKFSRKCTK